MPVVFSLVVQVPIAIAGTILADTTAVVGGATIALSVLGPLLLLWIRQYPGPIVAILSAAGAADFLLGYSWMSPPYVALAFAIVIAISHGARTWTWVSMIAAWEATLLMAVFVGIELDPHRVIPTTIGLLLVLGFAEMRRKRRDNLAKFSEALAQRRDDELRQERTRIARELHDVLAHSLSQINVQAGVGLHLMHKQPEQAEAALASIKTASKEALDEVRSMLGMLRDESAGDEESDSAAVPPVPEPDLSRLEHLAATVRQQGLEVELRSEISEHTPAALQLALFRIVQESLTNVVRHAAASTATVVLVVAGDEYLVTIADDGVGIDSADHSEGRGLLGMRERAELLGGAVVVAAGAHGGTVVTARIPRRTASV